MLPALAQKHFDFQAFGVVTTADGQYVAEPGDRAPFFPFLHFPRPALAGSATRWGGEKGEKGEKANYPNKYSDLAAAESGGLRGG